MIIFDIIQQFRSNAQVGTHWQRYDNIIYIVAKLPRDPGRLMIIVIVLSSIVYDPLSAHRFKVWSIY